MFKKKERKPKGRRHRGGNKLSSLANETEGKFPDILSCYPERITNATVNTKYYDDLRRLKIEDFEAKESAQIRVVNGDTFDVARLLQEEGLSPLVLNMASCFKPGGGWRNGAKAQEESLFYRSTYAISLENCLDLDTDREWRYPLKLYSGVYSPDIYVFRDNAKSNYTFMRKKDCFWVDMVAISALKRPKLTNDGHLNEKDRLITYHKIEGIFKIALENGHDSLVLGALGCGAYQNPPEDVAKIFQMVIRHYERYFRRITFAIIDDKNSNGNLSIFKRIFQE